MHEMAIAQGILDIVLQTAAQNGANRVQNIRLLVGEMTQIVPEALEFGFKALAAGSIAETAQIEIAIVPLEGKCGQCNQRFKIEQFRFICTKCGSANVRIVAGRELKVDSLEVE